MMTDRLNFLKRYSKLRAGGIGILCLGFGFGICFVLSSLFGGKIDTTKVVLRYSIIKKIEDYDLQTATNYLIYRLEKSGFEVIGKTYTDDLYPKETHQAGINIFVRGFFPFYDVRFADGTLNINYLHRTVQLYFSELNAYDLVLSSQKGFAQEENVKAEVLPVSYIPHEKLIPHYANHILYIYEYYNAEFVQLIRSMYQIKAFGGAEFARLSSEQQREELRKARVVVYEMGPVGHDDPDYVPYAVYDLMSYGRPLVTTYKKNLDYYFRNQVGLFNNLEEMVRKTYQMLQLDDDTREKRADDARNILYKMPEEKFTLPDKILKLQHNL